ncbi:hypothetical protein AB2B38_008490 [Balneola sp. MJW-20]|uniref:hypothetical protein n=1 Tax=Gracilimonas aurantiaca TaxID=3234185 RepID=UPI0034676C5E
MKRSIILSAIVCLAISLNVFAQNGATKTVDDFNSSFFVPCSGEIINLQGTRTLVSKLFFDENGGLHVMGHFSINAKGADSQGNAYNLNYNRNFNLNNPTGPGFTRTVNLGYNLIGQGKAPNLKVRRLMHITVNSNGEVTSSFGNFDVSCK